MMCNGSFSLNDYSSDQKQQIVESCPTNVFEFDPSTNGGAGNIHTPHLHT